MTRKQALETLLAKIEAGAFDGTPGGEFRPRFNAFMDIAERAFGQYEPVGLPELAWRSYNHKSLDAALALHEAVLPGCNQYSIVTDPTCLKVTVCWWPDGLSDGRQFYGEAWGYPDKPARAWLMAIIKALIAMEDEQ